MKRCGKSAPRRWQHLWQGKPHREQCQIGTARRVWQQARRGHFCPSRSGLAAVAVQATAWSEEWSSPVARRGQNPAYRPSAHNHGLYPCSSGAWSGKLQFFRFFMFSVIFDIFWSGKPVLGRLKLPWETSDRDLHSGNVFLQKSQFSFRFMPKTMNS